jgi:hypothetical protein
LRLTWLMQEQLEILFCELSSASWDNRRSVASQLPISNGSTQRIQP